MNAVSNDFLGLIYKPRLEINKRIKRILDRYFVDDCFGKYAPRSPHVVEETKIWRSDVVHE